ESAPNAEEGAQGRPERAPRAEGDRPARPPRTEGAGGRSRGGRGRSEGDDRGGRNSGRDDRGGRDGGSDDRGGRSRDREDMPVRPRGSSVSPDDEVLVPGTPDELPRQPIADPADDMDLAGSTLRDILTLLGLSTTEITARVPDSDGDGIGLIEQVFDIFGADDDTSDELGVLIGRRGETLASLQYVVNTIVARGQQKAPVFGIDIEGYKRRREQMLVDLAHEIAQEVRETGDVITLEPMPAYERRIIHLALREESGVKTESVGTGEHRQVEILPAD
ncbi:MAG: KH domain-containing protein, partial [Chloroflexi bacterium]|nr:KH domain-containing protein [Chloroflexota bacterium]